MTARVPRVFAWAFALLAGTAAGPAHAQTSSLAAAILPASRSVQVLQRGTVFATIINTGQAVATGCRPVAVTPLPITFTYQAADGGTNQPVGSPALPVDIPAGATQAFVLTITPTEAFAPTNLRIDFVCDNAGPAPASLGVNSLLLSAEHQPTPDIVAMAVTASGDGILTLHGGQGSFAVATVNLGSPGQIAVSADTGTPGLPLTATVCQTRPASGECMTPPAPLVSLAIGSSATPTFGVFAQASSEIGDDPAGNRIHVRFVDATGAPRGATSVSVRSAADGTSGRGDPSPPSPRAIAPETWIPIAMDRPGFYASWLISGKHGRCAFNSASGWIYCMGGDWYSFNDPAEQGNGNNEIWRYNVATNEWRKEYPPGDSPCAPAGDIVPPQPDESTWVYDSRRNVFHLMPGFWFGTAAYRRSCAAATTHWGHLIYDPAATRYAVGHFQAPAAGWGGDLRGKSGIYDPVRDEVVRFDIGPAVQRWNVGTGALTEEPLPLGGAFVEQDPMAFDPQGRTVYGIDYSGQRLVRYHLDTKQVKAWPMPANYAWDCPGAECFDGNQGNITFDEARRVLVLPNMPNKGGLIQHLYTFDVVAESWQEIPLVQPAGAIINGNTMAYDSVNDVHFLIGGRVTPHFFLFRLAGP